MNVLKRYNDLISILKSANEAYTNNQPIISDIMYDKLYHELENLENHIPEENRIMHNLFETKNNFTINDTKKVKHVRPMLSLNNTYDGDDILHFDKLIRQKLNLNKIQYSVEEKIDGLSLSLIYVNGILVSAVTRGDGYKGDDVLSKIECIGNIPTNLGHRLDIEVRGEIYMDRNAFLNLKDENGNLLFSNTRNAAAGSLRLLDNNVIKTRGLKFIAYYIYSNYKELSTQELVLLFLKKLNFVTTNYYITNNINYAIDIWERYNKGEVTSEVDIDGLVGKVNEIKYWDELGINEKSPKWAIAFKFDQQAKLTKVIDIVPQVGTQGSITPVAIVNPVEVSGSVITKVTLHNYSIINNIDIRIGDTVGIEKSGGVIPQITHVEYDKRNGTEIIPTLPTNCPVCGGIIGKLKDEYINDNCLNENCPAKLFGKIVKLVSKDGFNIMNIGEQWIQKLIDDKVINNIFDIFYLDQTNLLKYDKMGDVLANKIIKNIIESKKIEQYRFIYSLSIPNVGMNISKRLSKLYSINELIDNSFNDIVIKNEFGNEIGERIISYFRNENNISLLKDHINIFDIYTTSKGDKLSGLTFVVTGSFDGYDRNSIKKIIDDYNGKVTDSISKKTNYLICGEKAGSKLEKAKKIPTIKIISLTDFFDLIK